MFGYAFSWDVFWGQTTAAWVQALGAIGALAIAIRIDRKAAERMRSDREAEWQKRRDEAEAAASLERRARVDAVRNCIYALEALERTIEAHQNGQPPAFPFWPSEAARRMLRAAISAIDYHMSMPGPGAADLIALLALTQQTMAPYGDTLLAPSPDSLNKLEAKVRADAGYLRQLLEEYQHGVL